MEQFQNDFLSKLKSSTDQVQEQVKNLNKALKQAKFGTDQYQFKAERNPDYADYYDMIMAPELMEGEGGLFALPFRQKYGKLIETMFSQIAMSDDTQANSRKQSELLQNIERFTDFRTYLKFDLETTDQNNCFLRHSTQNPAVRHKHLFTLRYWHLSLNCIRSIIHPSWQAILCGWSFSMRHLIKWIATAL